MKLAVLITPVVLAGALASSASAQTFLIAPSTTASSAVLSADEEFRPAPNLHERRALASAAFEKPPALTRKTVFRNERPRDQAPFETQVHAKDEWTSDEGPQIVGARFAYKTRF